MSELFFTVIIPTYNRPDEAAACLAAISRVHYDKHRFEVIVVDDGGSSDLESIVLGFQGTLQVRLVRQSNSGPSSARNRGAQSARGQYLLFTDDDCEPDANWLAAFDQRLRQLPSHMIGGAVVNGAPQDLYALASQSVLDSLYEHYNRGSRGARFFASNNLVVPAKLFEQVGGFNTEFRMAAGEDREFCDRWLQSGYGLAFAPDAVILHRQRSGLGAYWKQHFRYGRGALQYRRLAREAGRAVSFEGLGLYSDILGRPLRGSWNWRGLRGMCAVAVSQAAVALGYLYEGISASRRQERRSHLAKNAR